jgi:hypothetical protein
VIHSHLLLLAVFSMFVSTVFATLMRDDVSEQLRLGLKMFGGMIAGAIVLGWLMYPFPI